MLNAHHVQIDIHVHQYLNTRHLCWRQRDLLFAKQL